MKVSLKEFIRNGSFGSMELSMSRASVEQVLGSPEGWQANSRTFQQAKIWKYGDIEFHFQNDALCMIFVDDFRVPTGGNRIDLNAWVVNGNLTCSQAEQHLSSEAIAYRKEDFPHNENGVYLVTSAGTVLAFSGEELNQPTLHAIHRQLEAS